MQPISHTERTVEGMDPDAGVVELEWCPVVYDVPVELRYL